MKFTLAEIKTMRPSLLKLIKLELPAKISYRLGKFLSSYSKEYVRAEDERVKLVKKYAEGEPDDEGDQKVKDENRKQFRKEFKELLQEETELDIKEPIKLSELGDIRLSPLDFSALQKIIVDK